MRIFLFHYYNAIANPAYGQISQAMRSLGHEVIVAYRNQNDELMFDHGERTELGIAAPRRSQSRGVIAAVLNKFYFLLFVLKVRHFIKQWQPDVVQMNRANVSWYWVIPLLVPGSKFVLDCRQVAVRKTPRNPIRALRQWSRSRFHLLTIKHLFHKASYLHVRGAEKELGNQWPRHAMVVPLGVSDQFLQYQPGEAEADESISPVLKFIYIGSITRVRKLELLLEAAKLLNSSNQGQFQLLFAGPDNTEGYYQSLVAKWQLQDVVTFLGPTPYQDIPQLLLKQDVALAYVPDEPQDWVYQPTLKILEYQALGIPVLASDVPPNADIIHRYHNGLVVDNNPNHWQKAMQQFLQDRDFFHTTRANAANHRSGDSWLDVAKLYVNEYQKLI